MRKILIGMLVLGLSGLATVYLTSCAKQAGPLSPNLHLKNAGDFTHQLAPQVANVIFPTAGNLTQTAKVYFNQPINPATLNASTVLLYTQDEVATGASETLYTNYSLTYNVAAKELVVYPTDGMWTDNKHYHAVLTTGVQSISGVSLDGNMNEVAEGPEFDNAHAFHTIGVPATAPGYVQSSSASLASVRVVTANWNALPGYESDFSFGADEYIQDPLGTYQLVTITVRFGLNGSKPAIGPDANQFQLDPTTFFTDSTHLHPNIVFVDETGAGVTPVYVEVTTTPLASGGIIDDTLKMTFNLAAKTKYKLKIKGGLTGIRSSSSSNVVLTRGLYFDSPDSGTAAEASDDTEWAVLQTQESNGTAIPTLDVSTMSNANYNSDLRRITIGFNVNSNTGLDLTTINNTNIVLINTSVSPNQPIVPTSITWDNSDLTNPQVFVDVPTAFRMGYNGYQNVRIFVSPNVKDGQGNKMDQSGNGVTGEEDDGYSFTFTGSTIYNYGY